MIEELVYTSAQQGLKPGSHGFCTVASTPGMTSTMAALLESLSAYRHLGEPGDDAPGANPPAYSHLRAVVGGKPVQILSRVGDAGFDYSGRSNKIAHLVSFAAGVDPECGPVALQRSGQLHFVAWTDEPRILPPRPSLPAAEVAPAVCRYWQEITGDAGWGGVVGERLSGARPQDIWLIVPPTSDTLRLLAESIAVLPPGLRWRATYSTYFTKLPPGIDCRVRCVVDGTPEAIKLRKQYALEAIDLCRQLGNAPNTRWTESARTGVPLGNTASASVADSRAPAADCNEYELEGLPDELDLASLTPSAPPPLPRSRLPSGPTQVDKNRHTTILGVAVVVTLLCVTAVGGVFVYRYAATLGRAAAEVEGLAAGHSNVAEAPQADASGTTNHKVVTQDASPRTTTQVTSPAPSGEVKVSQEFSPSPSADAISNDKGGETAASANISNSVHGASNSNVKVDPKETGNDTQPSQVQELGSPAAARSTGGGNRDAPHQPHVPAFAHAQLLCLLYESPGRNKETIASITRKVAQIPLPNSSTLPGITSAVLSPPLEDDFHRRYGEFHVRDRSERDAPAFIVETAKNPDQDLLVARFGSEGLAVSWELLAEAKRPRCYLECSILRFTAHHTGNVEETCDIQFLPPMEASALQPTLDDCLNPEFVSQLTWAKSPSTHWSVADLCTEDFLKQLEVEFFGEDRVVHKLRFDRPGSVVVGEAGGLQLVWTSVKAWESTGISWKWLLRDGSGADVTSTVGNVIAQERGLKRLQSRYSNEGARGDGSSAPPNKPLYGQIANLVNTIQTDAAMSQAQQLVRKTPKKSRTVAEDELLADLELAISYQKTISDHPKFTRMGVESLCKGSAVDVRVSYPVRDNDGATASVVLCSSRKADLQIPIFPEEAH